MALTLAALVTLTLAPSTVRADDLVRGQTFDIAIVGFPAQVTVGESLSGRLVITMHDTGDSVRQQVTFVMWSETPYGRSVYTTRTRSIAPGTTKTIPLAFAYNTLGPPRDIPGPIPFTLGVTVVIRSESLEAWHDIMIMPPDWV